MTCADFPVIEPEFAQCWQWVMDSCPSHAVLLDAQCQVLLTNQAWDRFAADNDAVMDRCGCGVDYLQLCEQADDDHARQVAEHLRTLRDEHQGQFECVYPCHGPNEQRWFTVRGEAKHFADRLYILIQHENCTERQLMRDAIQRASEFDPLTGLNNAGRFRDLLRRRLRQVRRGRAKPFRMIMANLDDFRMINNTLGHAGGDEVLRHVARQLREYVAGTQSVVARIDGDNFGILCEPQCDNHRQCVEVIQEMLCTEIQVGEKSVRPTFSIGVVDIDETYTDVDALLCDADIALRKAKHQGRGKVVHFRHCMRSEAVRRVELEVDLHRAMKQQEFQLYFQPIWRNDLGTLAGFESLIRWEHPRLGQIMPTTFIPIAERLGLISELGLWVADQSCAQMARWRIIRFDLPDLFVSVNLSARQLEDPHLFEQVLSCTARHGLKPGSMCLEVTETGLLQQQKGTQLLLQRVREHGIQLHVDDFGVGYGSLSYLNQYPFDVVKIDRSFISRIEERPQFIRAIVAMAHSLGLTTVAEGVETQQQYDLVRELGCDYTQGYYLAKPMPAEIAEEYLEAQPCTRLSA